MFFSIQHLLPPVLIFDPAELLGEAFWVRLYATGAIGRDGFENLLIVVVVRLLLVAALIVAANVVVGLLRRMITHGLAAAAQRAGDGQRRLTTLQGLLVSTMSYAVYSLACLLALFTIGISWKALSPLLAAASVIGLAIGFGAQRLVRDVITGLFILGEGQFDVGDWVTIGGVSGRIEEMGLRVTRMRDEQGRAYVIANGDITQVFNASRGLVKLPIELNLQRSPSLDRALVAIRRTAEDVLEGYHIPATDDVHPITLAIVGIEAAKVTVRVTLWVPVTEREAIENAVRRGALDALESAEVMLA